MIIAPRQNISKAISKGEDSKHLKQKKAVVRFMNLHLFVEEHPPTSMAQGGTSGKWGWDPGREEPLTWTPKSAISSAQITVTAKYTCAGRFPGIAKTQELIPERTEVGLSHYQTETEVRVWVQRSFCLLERIQMFQQNKHTEALQCVRFSDYNFNNQ